MVADYGVDDNKHTSQQPELQNQMTQHNTNKLKR